MYKAEKKIRYIKVYRNGKLIKIACRRFKGRNINTVKALIEKAGLKPLTFTELMLLIDGPYGDFDIPERCKMASIARKLINLNSYYHTNFRKEFKVGNYEVCDGIGAYGSGGVPRIKSLDSPKYIGFTQMVDGDQQYLINISQLCEPGLKYEHKLTHLDEAICIQAKTVLDGYHCTDLNTFCPSYRYSPRFDTKIIIKSVNDSDVSRKCYIGFGSIK